MNNKLMRAAVLSFGLVAASAQAVTIVNGSFEEGINPGPDYVTLPAGSDGITGWTIGGAGVDYVGGYWQASDGVRSVDLSGGSAGSVSQAIATEVGKTYTVTFDLSGNPDGGPGSRLAVVSIAGSLPLLQTFEVTADQTREDMNWETFSYVFTAFSTSSVLTFASAEYSPYGPALDNVSILEGDGSGSTVPEPQTWGMLVIGLGLVGLSVRRRRQPGSVSA